MRRASNRRDREAAMAFIDAVRRGQEARPCAVAVEEVARIAQQAKGLPTPVCSGPADVFEARGIVQRHEAVAKGYEAIAAQVSQFDVRTSAAAGEATSRAAHIDDPALKRGLAEAQAALERREEVTAAVIADWRNLSQAENAYSKRLETALLKADKAACTGLVQGVAAKGPAEILVQCNKDFDQARAGLDEKLVEVERLATR
jgi:hypothetical protein